MLHRSFAGVKKEGWGVYILYWYYRNYNILYKLLPEVEIITDYRNCIEL